MSENEQSSDRRAFPRFAASMRARVSDEDGVTADGEVINISEGGVLINGAQLPLDGRVRIELELDELGWQEINAEVVRAVPSADGPGQLAARFAGVAASGERDAIRAFLQEHFAE
ncbi:MAG: PilZ domain-containing protein [Thermoleophilia bacterium]|nr:PilZ domain-containing protein [Thermoleophilia bacterium]